MFFPGVLEKELANSKCSVYRTYVLYEGRNVEFGMSENTFINDLNARDAMARLHTADNAILVDVRLAEELDDVGMPDVAKYLHAEWITMPFGAINPDFVSEVEQAGIARDAEIFVLCRVGSRSLPAAQALTEAGFDRVYNVIDGFEGEADENGYRGTRGGWQFEGLPWKRPERLVA